MSAAFTKTNQNKQITLASPTNSDGEGREVETKICQMFGIKKLVPPSDIEGRCESLVYVEFDYNLGDVHRSSQYATTGFGVLKDSSRQSPNFLTRARILYYRLTIA